RPPRAPTALREPRARPRVPPPPARTRRPLRRPPRPRRIPLRPPPRPRPPPPPTRPSPRTPDEHAPAPDAAERRTRMAGGTRLPVPRLHLADPGGAHAPRARAHLRVDEDQVR